MRPGRPGCRPERHDVQLERTTVAAGNGNGVDVTVEGERRFAGERRSHDRDVLTRPGQRRSVRDAVPALDDPRPADAETEPQAAARQVVDRRGGHRRGRRRPRRHLQDPRADRDRRRVRCDPRREDGRIRPPRFRHPDRLEARRPRRAWPARPRRAAFDPNAAGAHRSACAKASPYGRRASRSRRIASMLHAQRRATHNLRNQHGEVQPPSDRTHSGGGMSGRTPDDRARARALRVRRAGARPVHPLTAAALPVDLDARSRWNRVYAPMSRDLVELQSPEQRDASIVAVRHAGPHVGDARGPRRRTEASSRHEAVAKPGTKAVPSSQYPSTAFVPSRGDQVHASDQLVADPHAEAAGRG
jgi:hypothetical protein